MKNLTFNFYFIEVPDEQYFPPFPKSAVKYLLFACTYVILQVGFANIRPDFEKLKMKAENYLKGKKKVIVEMGKFVCCIFILLSFDC